MDAATAGWEFTNGVYSTGARGTRHLQCLMPKIVKSEGQKGAEAEVEGFRNNLGPFVVAAETTRMAMVFTDATEPDNPIIFANDSFLSLTGYDREEVLGQELQFSNGARLPMLRRWRKLKPSLRDIRTAARKFSTAARMAASSGPPSSSARFEDENGDVVQYLPRSSISPNIKRSKRSRRC